MQPCWAEDISLKTIVYISQFYIFFILLLNQLCPLGYFVTFLQLFILLCYLIDIYLYVFLLSSCIECNLLIYLKMSIFAYNH